MHVKRPGHGRVTRQVLGQGRRLQPVDIQCFQFPAQPDRLGHVEFGMHVHHDGNVRTDALADGPGDGDGTGAVTGWGQFQSAVARGHESFGPVRRGGGVAAGASRVDFDPVPEPSPEQFMDRQVQRFAFQVPQGDVARGEGVDVEAGRMSSFTHAVEELLPQELHVEGVRADQYRAAQVFHDGSRRIGQYGTLPFAVADQARFGR